MTEVPAFTATGNCAGCKAPVIWAVTANDRRMPVDAEPVAPCGGGGNLRLTARGGLAPLAEVITDPAELAAQQCVWRNHFVTCPYAKHFRSRRPRRSR